MHLQTFESYDAHRDAASGLTHCQMLQDDADEAELEAKAEAEAKAESSGDPAAVLVAAGLRPELASVLVPRDSDPDTWDSDWEGPRAELLAWAVLLAHLLAKPGDSPERRLVSQALHDTHRCSLAEITSLRAPSAFRAVLGSAMLVAQEGITLASMPSVSCTDLGNAKLVVQGLDEFVCLCSLVPSLLTRLVPHLPLHSLPKASPGGAPKAAPPSSAAAAAAAARAQVLSPHTV